MLCYNMSMSEIIFAKSRHVYDSYHDFWALVQLSGYRTIWVDQIDLQSQNLYITAPCNGDYRENIGGRPDLKSRRCTLAVWMLERPGNGSLSFFRAENTKILEQKLADVIWCSDRQMSQDTGLHYVPMGSHLDLGQPGDEKRWDGVGLMAYSPRRSFLFHNPSFAKESLPGALTIAPNGWGQARDVSLRGAKIGLNVHQDGYPYCEPLRFAIFAAYALPILTETINPLNLELYTTGVYMTPLDNFVNRFAQVSASYERQSRAAGASLRNRLCVEHHFKELLESHI